MIDNYYNRIKSENISFNIKKCIIIQQLFNISFWKDSIDRKK